MLLPERAAVQSERDFFDELLKFFRARPEINLDSDSLLFGSYSTSKSFTSDTTVNY